MRIILIKSSLLLGLKLKAFFDKAGWVTVGDCVIGKTEMFEKVEG